MKSFSLLSVLALSASAVAVFAQEGTIIPDSPEEYTGCPACDLSFDSDIVSATAANDTFGVVLNFVDALATQEPATVTDVFCENATLWGTIGEDLYEANVAVNNAGSCLRMSFTIDVKNDCIAHLYSSYFPNDPENLRAADFANGMPWSGDTIQTGTLPAPNSAAGSCSSCDLKVLGDISTSDIEGVDGIMSAWVDGLLSQNSTAIADTHCPDSGSALWGTVSNARRNTFDEIKSYFDWFATSRNFTEEIKSVCSTLVKLSDTVFVEDRELRLGGQCLRMSYTIANEDGTYCIKSLTSSYVPEEPAGLVAADQRNLGGGSSPSEDTPVPPPSGVGNTIPVSVMTMVALTMMGILF